jgi:anti-sigma regulatory factor (Ser/Thr protein kinase)
VVANPVVASTVVASTVVASTVVARTAVASTVVPNTVVAGTASRASVSHTVSNFSGSPTISDSGWGWLRCAAEMAALAGGLPMAGRGGTRGRPCYPRIALKSPGTEPGSISAARRFTALMMQRWGAAERSADVSVVVSELLSNAVRHGLSPARPRCGAARPDIRLGLLHSGPGILCAVTDPSGQLPVPRSAGCLDEGGRGLHVIASLSDCWGSCLDVPGAAGKVVWATFLTAP